MKTFFKHLLIQLSILITLGVSYAAWNDIVNSGDALTATGWNDLITRVANIDNVVTSGQHTMIDGWPDAILCTNGTTDYYLYYSSTGPTTHSYAALPDTASGARYYITYNQSGVYQSQGGVFSSYDCVSQAKTIAQLYIDGQAFDFTWK